MFTTFHNETVTETLSSFLKETFQLKVTNNGTYLIDIDKDNKFILKDVIELPFQIISVFTTTPQKEIIEYVNNIKNIPLIISFILVINTYGSVHSKCCLRCNNDIRKKILSFDKKICNYLWIQGSCGSHWVKKPISFTKTFETLFIDNKKLLKVKEILANFNKNKKQYEKKGIPYKLTFLLNGRPGTGKTSFIRALSKEIKNDIFTINLNGMERVEEMIIGMNDLMYGDDDEDDENIICKKRIKSIIALEDIHKMKKELYDQVYNILDGAYDISNCIIVLTSNIPYNKLDKTLLRCGRVNYIIEFGYIDLDMKVKMFMNIVPQFEVVMKDFIEQIKNIKITPAILETYLLQYSFENEPSNLMKNVNTLIETALTENKEVEYDNNYILNPNIMLI